MDFGEDAIKVYLTVDSGINPPASKIQIMAPVNSTLYQVMVLGEIQHPGTFSFETKYYPKYGHMVTCINGLCQKDSFYWMVYDATTGEPLQTGVDDTYPKNDNSFIWKYENTSKYNIDEATPSTARKRVQDAIIVKISAVNDRDPSWPAVRNLPAVAESGSSLGEVMEKAQDQHPTKFRFTTDVDSKHGKYVKSINELQNDEPWNWLLYAPSTEKLLPTGLDNTFPKNKDAYLWRYSDKVHPSPGSGTEGQK